MIEGSVEHFQRFLGKYFVSIGFFDRTPPNEKHPGFAHLNDGMGEYHSISAFVVSVKDVWFLITAGHIIKDIETVRREGRVLSDFRIDDTWGIDAKHEPQLFHFDSAQKYIYFDDKQGADYGAIRLDENMKARLQANGIEPFDERLWKGKLPDTYDNYILLGIPSMFAKHTPKIERLEVTNSLAMVSLIKTLNPPEYMIKPIERFYGVKMNVVNAAGEPLTNFDGMSGSPVIAFRNRAEGLEYCLLGIQSAQDAGEEDHSVIAANYFMILGLTLERIVSVS
jgi:hypothetical protein